MKMLLNLSIILAVLFLTFQSLRAADSAAPTTGHDEPMLTVSLPDKLKVEDVSAAVAKAFVSLEWTDVANKNGTVKAFIIRRSMTVKATAICSATEIKVYADYDPGPRPNTFEMATRSVDMWLRDVMRKTKEELSLQPPLEKKS